MPNYANKSSIKIKDTRKHQKDTKHCQILVYLPMVPFEPLSSWHCLFKNEQIFKANHTIQAWLNKL